MDRISSRNLAIQIGFARMLAPALLLSALACTQATMSGGGRGVLNLEPGLPGHPGDNDATKNYFNHRVHFSPFDPSVKGHFRSGGNTFEIKVKAEKTTHARNWHSAKYSPVGEGYIVARIENVDDKDIPELGLTPNDEHAYIWIGELPSGKRGISFYTFKKDGSPLKKGTLDLDSFRFCRDYVGGKPTVTFGKNHSDDPLICDPPPRVALTQANVSAQLASYTPKFSLSAWTGGLWISCDGGCCDAGGGSFY